MAFPAQPMPHLPTQNDVPDPTHQPAPAYPTMPGPAPIGEPINAPNIDPFDIDTSSPEDSRVSFRSTDLESTLPRIVARFPNVEKLYFTKIFRGTIGPTGLIWLDIGRQDTSPLDFSDFPHLLYCFEVYGQIVCIMASAQGGEAELELQNALADYRIRLLKLSNWATFESVREWHSAFLDGMFRTGQDNPEGWRARRDDLEGVLRRKQ